jgi:hypothetical protein
MIFAMFFPPLYFILNKRIGMFFITTAMFLIAAVVAITVVFIPISIILWLIAIYMAARDLRGKKMTAIMTTHAELIATKMADKFPPAGGK